MFKKSYDLSRADAIIKVILRKLRKYYLTQFKQRTRYLDIEDSNWKLLEYLESYIVSGKLFLTDSQIKNTVSAAINNQTPELYSK